VGAACIVVSAAHIYGIIKEGALCLGAVKGAVKGDVKGDVKGAVKGAVKGDVKGAVKECATVVDDARDGTCPV